MKSVFAISPQDANASLRQVVLFKRKKAKKKEVVFDLPRVPEVDGEAGYGYAKAISIDLKIGAGKVKTFRLSWEENPLSLYRNSFHLVKELCDDSLWRIGSQSQIRYEAALENINSLLDKLTKDSDEKLNGPTLQEALSLRSVVHQRLKNRCESCKDAAYASMLNPSNVLSNITAGIAYREDDNFYRSLQYLEEALLLDSDNKSAQEALDITYKRIEAKPKS